MCIAAAAPASSTPPREDRSTGSFGIMTSWCRVRAQSEPPPSTGGVSVWRVTREVSRDTKVHRDINANQGRNGVTRGMIQGRSLWNCEGK